MNLKVKDVIISKWDSIILIVLTIIILILTYSLIPHEKIGSNPKIILDKTLISQEKLIFLERGKQSIQSDEIEYLDILSYNNKDNIFTLKFIETNPTKRFIVVSLTDPNNIVRFINIPIDETLINEYNLSKLDMQQIYNDMYIKIIIPSLDRYSIYGEWHLKIYLYNAEKELTAVIGEPLDYPYVSLNKIGSFDAILFGIISIFSSASIISILKKLWKKEKDSSSDSGAQKK